MSKKEKVTFEMLIEKLRELGGGNYNNNTGISIEIKDNKYSLSAKIKNYNKNIDIYCAELDEYITLQLNEYASLNIKPNSKHSFISFKNYNKKYNIYEYGISCNSQPISLIYDNILFKEIDNTCWLGLCLDDNQFYVYYNTEIRKYNKPYDKDNNDSFVKFKYNDLFLVGLTHYNKRINDFLMDFKKSNSGHFKEIAESLSISPLKSDFSLEMKELIEYVKIYNAYKDKFNLEQYESEIEEVYNFVVSLINAPMEASINNLQNLVSNTDLYDKEALKRLRSEIDTVLKSGHKTKKKVK